MFLRYMARFSTCNMSSYSITAYLAVHQVSLVLQSKNTQRLVGSVASDVHQNISVEQLCWSDAGTLPIAYRLSEDALPFAQMNQQKGTTRGLRLGP